ncbi:metallophosphoesterase family protein [Sphingomonas swuensis]|uniref:Metallophosphoesterase family protein n=1 Tax=Sphingomonas swuensis TaxID=977800 RepID=A0ABP7SX08_9SPHN
MLFRRMFQSTSPRARRGPDGWRAYVIGDVHGCLELLDRLLEDIASDHRLRAPAKGLLVLLGDLIDRGPASAEVIERLRSLDWPDFRVIGIAGNHEEVLLRILDGEFKQVSGWLKFGGSETLQSYGVDAVEIAALAPREAAKRIASAIPQAHRRFLEELADSFRFGDYLFVHAGVRPGIALDQQSLTDLRWIREPFLSDRRDHGMTVVHGHTVSERVEESGSRIGIDTGAYATGRLTALAIDGGERWFLDTVDGYVRRENSLA